MVRERSGQEGGEKEVSFTGCGNTCLRLFADIYAMTYRGAELLNGPNVGEHLKREKKGKLSNKEKKKLKDRDERKAGMEWKKGKQDRVQGGRVSKATGGRGKGNGKMKKQRK